MENIKVKEYLQVAIEQHPYYKSLNEKILKEAHPLRFYPPKKNMYNTNIKGTQYNFRPGEEPDSVKVVLQWIKSLIPLYYDITFSYSSNIGSDFVCRVDRKGDAISEGYSWLARYNKGDYTESHDHNPATLSFVYFVKSPPGSSPLVFTSSGKKIKSEEGKVVIFPGTVWHHVPKNKCDGRMTYAGNIGLKSEGFS